MHTAQEVKKMGLGDWRFIIKEKGAKIWEIWLAWAVLRFGQTSGLY